MSKILYVLIFASITHYSTAHSFSSESELKIELFRNASSGHVGQSYKAAREKLFNKIYLGRDSRGYFIEEVYCDDKFYLNMREAPTVQIPNPNTFNTEHTWPQSKFNSNFSKNTQKTDLHHLFPTFSRINSDRGNLPFAEVTNQGDLFCEDSRMGSSTRTGRGVYFEPPDDHKGNVARAMFYFSIRYQIAIDPDQEHFLRLWHNEDPVDELERARHEKIFSYQKNRNPFIDRPELVQMIKDF